MKLLVFTFLLSFSLVFAGNGPENSCFNGTSTNGEGEENIIACNFPFVSNISITRLHYEHAGELNVYDVAIGMGSQGLKSLVGQFANGFFGPVLSRR